MLMTILMIVLFALVCVFTGLGTFLVSAVELILRFAILAITLLVVVAFKAVTWPIPMITSLFTKKK